MVATTTSMDGFTKSHVRRRSSEELLLVCYDEQGARVQPLVEGEKVIVGREAPAKLVLTDPSLSRQHASFRRKQDVVLVEDLHSSNGTYLRGDRIRTAWLEPGDEVFLARVLVTLVVAGASNSGTPGGSARIGEQVFLALGKAYDDTQVGFATIDGEGQKTCSNNNFEALLARGDGISMAGNAVRFADDHAQRCLQSALNELCAGRLSPQARELFCVQRATSPRPYVVGIFTMDTADETARHDAGPTPSRNPNPNPKQVTPRHARMCLTVIDPDRSVQVTTDLLRQVYGITPAEARVANALAQGLRVHEIADQNGVSATTVRNQLKSLFTKTQTSSQADLVRVIVMTASAQRRRS